MNLSNHNYFFFSYVNGLHQNHLGLRKKNQEPAGMETTELRKGYDTLVMSPHIPFPLTSIRTRINTVGD